MVLVSLFTSDIMNGISLTKFCDKQKSGDGSNLEESGNEYEHSPLSDTWA
jgi:hypothetical protein